MTKDEAKKQFEERLNIHDYRNQIPDYYDAMTVAIECIDKAINERWIPAVDRLPENDDNVLIQVNGRFNNIEFINAIEIASYSTEEGWILDAYPEWETPNVIA